MSDINCIIIDDESKSIEVLAERLSILFPNIKVSGKYTDWKKGLEVLRTQKVDLLFLDVTMPEKSGIDILKLFGNLPFEVILVTAYSHFAIEAIKFSASGYVLKPIDDLELTFAVNKALQRIKDHSEPKVMPSAIAKNKLKIGIPNANGIDYLAPEEILYFESVNRYTKVVTRVYSILSSYNLGEFKKVIDENVFFHIHRSYIVNLYNVKRYESVGILIMEDNMQIPVSKNIRADFMAVFNKITRTVGFKPKEDQ